MGRRPGEKINTARLHDNNHVVLKITGESTAFLSEILDACRNLWANAKFPQLIQGFLRIEFDRRYAPMAGYKSKVQKHLDKMGVHFSGSIQWLSHESAIELKSKQDYLFEILNSGYGHDNSIEHNEGNNPDLPPENPIESPPENE